MTKKNQSQYILAIETSCDETAAAVLEYSPAVGFPNITKHSAVIKSQIKLHANMGGVVPETAARAHVKNILPVVKKALEDAQTDLANINFIAVTQGPGLIPSLIVGVEFAKALSLATGIPVIPINHMVGHLYSPFRGVGSKIEITTTKESLAPEIKNISAVFPMISLIVSGGHTMLIVMKNLYEYEVVGQTVDDAAGEAFDKVAKLLYLPYPGGPEVSKLALESKNPVDFPRPMIHTKDYNFSFSGLKTAVLYYTKDQRSRIKDNSVVSNICAGFQNAVVDVLVTKTMRAAKEFRAKSVSISGGVSANKALQQALVTACQKMNLIFFTPPQGLSTDNAEMIGIAAAIRLNTKKPLAKNLHIQANPALVL